MQEWFSAIEHLRRSDNVWNQDELPVELVQTHISVILLGHERVLKFKKPVNFGFLDYSTIEKRRIACEREVELNARLCPDVYLGVSAVYESEDGLRLDGVGEIVDYAVVMKRLPAERMLDRMVTEETIRESHVKRIAERLNSFHSSAVRGPEIDHFGGLETVRFNWNENFEQTKSFSGRTIREESFERIQRWVGDWLKDNEVLFRRRVAEGRICDGHGDLRCESVCVSNGICIFDCIEFNQRFRCGDVANEVAFLAMDLDAYGRPDLGYLFVEHYVGESGDEEIFKLLPFYRCYRAYVRGKVLSFQLDEEETSVGQKRLARERARNYFDIADRCARDWPDKPLILVVSGLSGTGKTTLARAVAGEIGARVVSSDIVRKSLFGGDGSPSGYGQGMYDEQANKLTYNALIEEGRRQIEETRTVVLDATFLRPEYVEGVRKLADETGADLRLLECKLTMDRVRERLLQRAKRRDGASEATVETFDHQVTERAGYGPGITPDLSVSTDDTRWNVARSVVDWLRTDTFRSGKQSDAAP